MSGLKKQCVIDMDSKTINKIRELGGTSKNGKANKGNIELVKSMFENIYQVSPPEEYLSFINELGAFGFVNDVKVKLLEPNPVADAENSVPVDCFYSIDRDAEGSVFSILEQYSDQIPKGFLPICDGVQGDFICICLKPDSFGDIYYWFHEAPVGSDIYFVAADFDSFILNLFNGKDQENENNKEDAKVVVTPALLELLKKSGHGPKAE